MLLHNVKNKMLKREVEYKLFKIIMCGYNIFMREANRQVNRLRYITQDMLQHDRTMIFKPPLIKFKTRVNMLYLTMHSFCLTGGRFGPLILKVALYSNLVSHCHVVGPHTV